MSVTWSGLEELKAALRNMPKELAAEGAELVDDAVEVTASRLFQVYPKGDTGQLRAGIRKRIQIGTMGAVGSVRSTSPHAHLWEWGTQSRRTKKGWSRGKAPEHKEIGLVPIAQQERRRMQGKQIELVRRAGFEVSGSF